MSTTVQSHHMKAKAGVSRRPAVVAALLLPAAPLVLLVLAAVFFGLAARHILRIRTVADDAAALTPAASVEAATTATRGVMATLRPTSKRALVGAAAIAVGVLLASTAAAGSYAFLNSRATLASTTTITSSTFSLQVSAGGGTAGTAVSFPASAYAGMLPGDLREQSVTLTNTAAVGNTVTVALASSVNSNFQIRLLTTACTGTLSNAAVLTTTSVTYGTLPANASATGCLQVYLPASTTVAQGTSANFTINVNGTQASS